MPSSLSVLSLPEAHETSKARRCEGLFSETLSGLCVSQEILSVKILGRPCIAYCRSYVLDQVQHHRPVSDRLFWLRADEWREFAPVDFVFDPRPTARLHTVTRPKVSTRPWSHIRIPSPLAAR